MHPLGREAVGDTKRSFSAATGAHYMQWGITFKAKRVAVAGEHHNCHEHGDQAEPQATADPARCASEPRPYLRHSALTNTCEALAM